MLCDAFCKSLAVCGNRKCRKGLLNACNRKKAIYTVLRRVLNAVMKRSILLIIVALSAPVFAEADHAFQSSIVGRHNALRAKHGAAALQWNANVAKVAQDWADRIARSDQMKHRQPNKYGENIFWMSGGAVTGEMVTNSWYGEIKDYNFARPGFGMSTGHFTQVVWKGSKEIGCGVAKSRRGGTYVVCNYNPPGNYQGRFPENVAKPK